MFLRWSFCALAALSFVGCGDDDAPATTTTDASVTTDATRTDPECEEIAQACHLYDKGLDSGLAHTCHQFHDAGSKVDDCRAMKAACLAACGGDAGAIPADTGTEAASDAASD